MVSFSLYKKHLIKKLSIFFNHIFNIWFNYIQYFNIIFFNKIVFKFIYNMALFFKSYFLILVCKYVSTCFFIIKSRKLYQLNKNLFYL